jgi:glycosyltransferase involved in cell wall biosynthesis
MTDIHVAIVAAGRRLAQARVLARTIAEVRPLWPITALVLASEYPLAPLESEPFESMALEDFGDAALVRRVSATPYSSQSLVAGPVLVDVLLDRGADAVLFLAPDTLVLSDPVELVELLDGHDAVVVPRLKGELPQDGERPDLRDLQEAGELDDGFFAVRGTESGRAVARWWAAQQAARIEKVGAPSAPSGLLEQLEQLEGVAVLSRPGYGVSVWNLHERVLEADGDGALSADGEPVRVLRLPGFRIDRPFWLADFATRSLALGDPILEPLCQRYAEDVRDQGWIVEEDLDSDDQPAAGWLGNGLRYDPRVRRLHHGAEVVGEDFGDLSTRAGAEALTRWLREPAKFGAAHGINRYAYDAWMARPDVASAYADLDDPEVANGFIGWLWVFGREEMELQERVLPPRPDWVAKTPSDPPSVLVTGYLRGVVGLGAAARGYVEALETAGIPLATRVLPTDPPETVTTTTRLREDEVPFGDRVLPDSELADIHLFCINADQTESTLARISAEERPAYTIGLWAWETDIIPRRWERAFPYVDEIWTYTTWIAENIGPFSPVPVVALPIPVRVPDAVGTRLPFELPNAFRFLFTFDFFSTTVRKNPVGLVEAFTKAFVPNEGPVLVLKTINGKLKPAERALVQKAASGRDDVLIIDGVVSDAELAALFEACDCYVSLHRAEGFGMTLAEAMALGKPVIATGWSGNMDFTTADNAYLVDYEARRVGPHNPPYDPAGTWAEPSIEHAAALMRQVWENQEQATERAALGRETVLSLLSAQSVGERARERLQQVATMTRSMAAAEAELPATNWADLTARLNSQVLAARQIGARGGAVGFAQRGLARALRPLSPYLSPAGGLDDTLVRTVGELAAEVQELRTLQAQSRARVRHLEYRLSRRV